MQLSSRTCTPFARFTTYSFNSDRLETDHRQIVSGTRVGRFPPGMDSHFHLSSGKLHKWEMAVSDTAVVLAGKAEEMSVRKMSVPKMLVLRMGILRM